MSLFSRGLKVFQTTIRIEPGDVTAKNGLERCLKASFVVRNNKEAREDRIYNNESVKEALEDEKIREIIQNLNEENSTGLKDYCTDGFKAAQLQKLIDVGLIAFDSP